MLMPVLFTLAVANGPAGDPDLQAKVAEVFDEYCTACHAEGGDPKDPSEFSLEGDLAGLVGRKANEVDKLLIAPGDPAGSYLMDKVLSTPAMKEELMPLGDDPLPAEKLQLISDWISSFPKDDDVAVVAPPGDPGVPPKGDPEGGPTPPDPAPVITPPKKKYKPFHGGKHIVLPTTTTLGQKNLQWRLDHRFGRIGSERGAFGLDAGVVMSMGLAYGIFDGWDVAINRTNSRKGWELGTKYVALRQEDDMPVSLGGYVSMDLFRDFDVENQVSGNFMLLLSRLWFERWATQLSVSYHTGTNHNTRVLVDFDDGDGAVAVEDNRGTLVMGLASQVWLGKRKKFAIDAEYFLPVPDVGTPNLFYYRGGDADPSGTKIGAWGLGGSYYTGKHYFQVFFTNNREIHPNLAAPGGQSKNPFKTDDGVDDSNPFNEFNFYLGFNLVRQFTLGKNAARWKKNRQAKKNGTAEAK